MSELPIDVAAPDVAAAPASSWQAALRAAARDAVQLAAGAGLGPEGSTLLSPSALAAARQFPVRVPRELIARMRPGDPLDPLLRQFAPSPDETRSSPGWGRDPLGEAASSPVPGLLHKYPGRVLLVLTGACPVHCRYCFRRHFPYGDHAMSDEAIARALDYVRADPSIHEVILSGGDPLSFDDDRLSALEEHLASIPHLSRLRVHTRWPIAIPSRVNESLLGWLERSRLRPVMVVHANHPAEIDDDVGRALEAMRRRGLPVLNQSVLLRGVNDSVDALCELSERLFAVGTLPYYLHLLDHVDGAEHFEVGEPEARELVSRMTERLPGYLVPRLVREVPGKPAKTIMFPGS